jgi:hypothetical protein
MVTRNQLGVTVLELVAASIVTAVLLSLAIPAVFRVERRLGAYVAASTFRSDVTGARQHAILDGATVRVVLDTLVSAYQVEDVDRRVLRRRELRTGLALKTTAHQQEILFSPRGTSNLYSTTWIGVRRDPDGRWYGLRVLPSGAIEDR